MIGFRQIPASRLLAAALLAIGCALMLAPAPAIAQEQTPWYLPQPWVRPPATGPQVRPLLGYYGSTSYSQSPYGSFSSGCYGDCGYLRGTIATGSGVVLYRPTVVAYDQSAYEIVPRGYYRTQTVYVPVVQRVVVNPRVVHTAKPMQKKKVLPQYTVQNGVRIIRPAPLPAN
jgi:hypothetical protein